MTNKSNPAVLALCPYCGSFYSIEGEEEVKGCCGRKECIAKKTGASTVMTPVTGTNISIVSYSNEKGSMIIPEQRKGDYIDLDKRVDTTEKDRKNAEETGKKIIKAHGRKRTTKSKVRKKAKSGRVSKKGR